MEISKEEKLKELNKKTRIIELFKNSLELIISEFGESNYYWDFYDRSKRISDSIECFENEIKIEIKEIEDGTYFHKKYWNY